MVIRKALLTMSGARAEAKTIAKPNLGVGASFLRGNEADTEERLNRS